jgi:hypothetical protein
MSHDQNAKADSRTIQQGTGGFLSNSDVLAISRNRARGSKKIRQSRRILGNTRKRIADGASETRTKARREKECIQSNKEEY